MRALRVGLMLLAASGGVWLAASQARGGVEPGDGGFTIQVAADTFPPAGRRPFLHRQHQGVSCLECHGGGEDHGVVLVRTARDCAACHHDPGRSYACQDCHAPARVSEPEPRPVHQNVLLTVWDEPRSLTLPFEHDIHGGIECGSCHTAPVTLAVEVDCATCHQDHHRPEADCSACHTPAAPGAHGLEVHLTCASSGCHTGAAGVRPAPSRSSCLVCHPDKRDHEPGLRCEHCHMVPGDPLAPGSGEWAGPHPFRWRSR